MTTRTGIVLTLLCALGGCSDAGGESTMLLRLLDKRVSGVTVHA